MFLKELLRSTSGVRSVEVDDALLAEVAAYLDEMLVPAGVRLAPTCEQVEARDFDALVCEACAGPDTTGSFGPIPEVPPVAAPVQDFSAFAAPVPTAAVQAASAPERVDLSELLDRLDEGFSVTLLRLIDARGMTDAQVYKRANLSRQHFSKIRKDPHYRPTKRTAFALAVALELSLDETEDLLERAGFAISHSSKFDVILEYFIGRGLYDVFAINEVLFAYDQVLLG